MDGLADDVIDVNLPTVKDVQKPVKAVKKTLGVIELAAGAMLEKTLVSKISGMIPGVDPLITDVGEMIALGLANEMVDQKDAQNMISGGLISVALRIGDNLISKAKNLMGYAPKIVNTPSAPTNSSYINYQGEAYAF